MNKKEKSFVLSIFLFVLILVYTPFCVFILEKCGVNINNLNYNTKVIINFLINISLMLILFLIYRKDLKEEAKDYKANFKKYFKFGLKIWLIGVGLMFISNIIIQLIYKNDATNEIMVQEMIQKAPLYMIFSTAIFSPFVEEIIFRKSIKNFIDNNFIYIVISGLAFGFMHTLANPTNILELLYIIPYGAVGACFAYTYSKTKNIYVSMTFHSLHNLIIVLYSIIIYTKMGIL